MTSSLAEALSTRSVEDLRRMLDAARIAAQRAQFEVEVIDEALSTAQDRPTPKSPKNPKGHKGLAVAPPSDRHTPQEVRDMVLRIVGELGPVPPKGVKEAIGDDSVNVYNPLGQLVKEGKLTRDDGLYALPTSSANGLPPGGLEAGTAA